MEWPCRQDHGHHCKLLKPGHIWRQEKCNCKDWDTRPFSELFISLMQDIQVGDMLVELLKSKMSEPNIQCQNIII